MKEDNFNKSNINNSVILVNPSACASCCCCN